MVNNPFSTISGPSTVRYDPYGPPRKPPNPAPPAVKPLGIRFHDSPFYRIDQAASVIAECPESSSPSDRKQQHLSFTLNNDQLTKLKSPGSKYQVRLFCTSSVFYAGTNAYRVNTVPCPIEFPPTCEVRVNNVQLSANLKGLKKKPGTAPPADITTYLRLSGVHNRIEMVYVNSQQPPQLKKYYLVVMLVETTSVDQLVSELNLNKRKSSQEIVQSMIASLSEDDDIIAGPQKLSLKCPLSFLRITNPCRSTRCVHSQCFDANSWFSVMEQTTTWMCPVCERVLDHTDLIIDEFFAGILKACPDSVEDVMLEANGEWHTSDNTYASYSWKASHPAASPEPPPPPPSPKPTTHSSSQTSAAAHLNGKLRDNDSQVFVLDSDDEDEGQVKRALSLSLASTSSLAGSSVLRSQSVQGEGIIDLTIDSDDEQPRRPQQTGKRKATDSHAQRSISPAEQSWKKSRLEGSDRDLLRNGGYQKMSVSHIPSNEHQRDFGCPPTVSPVFPLAADSTPGSNRLPSINALIHQVNGRWV